MLSNEPWEHLVPIAVANVIKEIDGVQRLKDVFKNDEFF
jgi:nicotinamide mononucleotide adenylyltransferase